MKKGLEAVLPEGSSNSSLPLAQTTLAARLWPQTADPEPPLSSTQQQGSSERCGHWGDAGCNALSSCAAPSDEAPKTGQQQTPSDSSGPRHGGTAAALPFPAEKRGVRSPGNGARERTLLPAAPSQRGKADAGTKLSRCRGRRRAGPDARGRARAGPGPPGGGEGHRPRPRRRRPARAGGPQKAAAAGGHRAASAGRAARGAVAGRSPAAELSGGQRNERRHTEALGGRDLTGRSSGGPARVAAQGSSQASERRAAGAEAGRGGGRRGRTHRAGPCSGGSGSGRSQAFKMAAAGPQHRYRRRRDPCAGTFPSASRPLPAASGGHGGGGPGGDGAGAARHRRRRGGQSARTTFLGGSTRDAGLRGAVRLHRGSQ